MGVKVREKTKGSGIWWIFIDHRGRRKAKKIGKDRKVAESIAKKVEAKLVLGDMGLVENKTDKAATFEEGKALLESQVFDVAILDIMGVDGYGLLEIATGRKWYCRSGYSTPARLRIKPPVSK